MTRQQRWKKVCKSLLNILIFLSVWSFNSAEEVERTVWWTTAVIHLWKIILFGSFHQQLRKSCCIYFKGEFKNLKILISLQSLARSWRVLSQSAFTNAWWAGRQYSLQSQFFFDQTECLLLLNDGVPGEGDSRWPISASIRLFPTSVPCENWGSMGWISRDLEEKKIGLTVIAS